MSTPRPPSPPLRYRYRYHYYYDHTTTATTPTIPLPLLPAPAVPVAQWPQMADPNAVLPPASQLAVLAPLDAPAAPWPPLSPFPPAAALGVAIPLDLPAVAAASPWWPPLNLFLPAAALGAVIPVSLPPPAPAAAAAAAAGPDAAAAAVTAKPPTGGYFQHPLGCMFCPELDKAGVLAVVSEVLCAPGFVSGPSEEARLLRSVGSGRIDIQTMSRLLRWLRGERAARELRGRGVNFVGPETDDVVRPITTGLGMSHLMKEVTKLLFCFCFISVAFFLDILDYFM